MPMIKKFLFFSLMTTFLLSGCIVEPPEISTPVRGAQYYDGPAVRPPFTVDTPEEELERTPREYLNILTWLPFEEHYPYDDEEAGEPGEEDGLPENLPGPETSVIVDINLDFEEELLLVSDEGPPVPLPVTGNGEVWGAEESRFYNTDSRNRFDVLLNGWQIRDYTVSAYDTNNYDMLSSIGVKVSNQAWYWLDRNKDSAIRAGDMPVERSVIDEKLRERVTSLGLQLKTATSDTDGRRGLYLSEITISRNLNDGNNDIVIQNNPNFVIANHPERGGRYEGWTMLIDNYLPGNEQLQVRNGDEGLMLWPGGDVYVGNWKDDRRDGQGTYSWPDGKEYAGQWKEGVIEGQGRITWPDGREYIGPWRDGTMHGKGAFTHYRNGIPSETYEGRWSDGKAEGLGIMTFDDGSIYRGSWSDGLANGGGSYLWPDGREYRGSFSDGSSNGQGNMSWPDGSFFTGNWQDGLIHGRGIWRDEDGTSIRGRWEEGNFVR